MEPQGRRMAWHEVPRHVRAEVEARLGSGIVSAENQPGGFSPGVAARCRLADGRRCFVKAVSPEQNRDAVTFHRREAAIAATLPDGLPVPMLLDVVDDGHWVVLVFEEIEGHPPPLPWRMPALAALLATLDRIAELTTPCRGPELPSVELGLGRLFTGFRRIAADDALVERVDDWTHTNLHGLVELEANAGAAASGTSLLHCDLRADNLLVRADGTFVVVDWPHAAIGAPWVDVALLLPSVGLDGGPTPVEVETALDPFAATDPDRLTAVVAGLAGYFTFQALLPDPPGIPTVRAFQRAQAAIARDWLRARLAGIATESG